MSPQMWGIVVGGLIPAVGYALFGIWTKIATEGGLGAGPFLVIVGAACALVGAVFSWALPATWNLRAGSYAFAAGAFWAIGSGLVSFTLLRWQIPISKLNPIYNTNTLLAVLLGLVIFSEWKQVDTVKLLAGSVLILAGSMLVAKA